MTDKKLTKKEQGISKSLCKIVDELVVELKMEDWDIEVKYVPKKDSDSCADVEFSIHREATVNVYKYNNYTEAKKDLAHELGHCKVGLIRKAYEKVIEAQYDLIKELVQNHEEIIVDDLIRMLGVYDDGKRKRK